MAEPWTKEEIGRYEDMRRKELGPMYAAAGIPVEEPWRRAEYLFEILRPHLAMTDEDVLNSITKRNGKPDGLRFLEDVAVDLFI